MAGERRAALSATLRAVPWGLMLRAAAVLAVLLLIVGSWRPAVWPFKTYGAIYVDSPEVYTRERLVNDRYDQDHWLRKQLDALDVDPNLIARMLSETLIVQAQGGPDGAGDGAATPGGGVAMPTELDFSDQFTITAGVRDRIRQMILENMLDDRHDLLGNSMYGFKFDTTVLPGANTSNRAFVRVRASIERFFASGDGAADTATGLPAHLFAALQQDGAERERLEQYNTHYTNWLANIQSRLNNFVANYYGYNGPGCPADEGWEPDSDLDKAIMTQQRALRVQQAVLRDMRDRLARAQVEGAEAGAQDDAAGTVQAAMGRVDYIAQQIEQTRTAIDKLLLARDRPLLDDVTVRALQTILSMPPEAIQASLDDEERSDDPRMLAIDEIELREPDPWRLFFDLVLKEVMTACGPRPQFVVREARDTVYVIEADETGAMPDWASDYYFAIRTPAAMRGDAPEPRAWDDGYVAVSYDGIINSLEEYDALVPRFDFPADFLVEARRRGRMIRYCHDPARSTDDCPPGQLVDAFTISAGLFNLIAQLEKQDAYSYAVFPKSDAEGVLLRRRLDARAGAGGWMGLGRASSEQSAEASSVLVGFGDSRVGGMDNGDKAIEFGWVITPPESGDAVQRTQMALISVPAWADEVVFEVTSGWLDAESRERIEVTPYSVDVPLPPDFEALDIVMWGGALHVRRRPIILDDFMDPPHGPMVLAACRRAEILIPGTRLWRSTAVTLGGQTATRIRVMPNMDGILAEFTQIAAPARTFAAGTWDQRILRVWTSEGSATSSKDIRVIMPEGVGPDCRPAPADAATR